MSDPQFATFEAAAAGRFAFAGEIGRGNRAVVYRARDVVRADNVAIKILHSDIAAALDYGRFIHEMEHAQQVSHPGIVPLLGVTEIAGRLVIITPLLQGETLRARLNRERQLPLDDAVAIARQVADALRFAHAKDVLHKDVKPENIFLEGPRAVLMDMGLARAITRSMDETHTGTGLTLGTPAYMSPEHASGGVEIDARADLYSLGCVFYEMLAGRPPFTGATPRAVWMKTLTDTPAPISVYRESLPSDVGVTIEKLLAKAPAARFPDAEHVVDALSALHA
jgi:serine/threonine-protein kinase